MKALLIVALLFVSTFAVTHRAITNAERQKIDNLKKSGTWGGYMISLAEMHLMAQGPVDALINGIQEVLADLDRKHTAADEAFARRTDEHHAEVRRLTDLINEANRNIADTQATLANVLRPQKAQLEESIADRERFVAETQQYIVDQTAQRQVQHEEYLVRVEETNGALAAIEEAQQLLATLLNGDASFVQVKKAKKSLDKVTSKLSAHKGVEKAFVQALVTLATNEFANAGAVQRVVDKLHEITNNLTAALVADTASEEQAQADWEADMAEKNAAINEANDQIADLNTQLDATEEQIATAEQFIVDRTADRDGFQAELDAENAQYEEDTRIYEDLVAQFDKEENACQQALDVIQGATFADYIGDRMSMDRVIDTNHGSGIATGAGTFDFQGSAPRMD